MQQKYPNVNQLIEDDVRAKAYYDKLPNYVQESIQERAQGVNSFESLCHYAENLTQGDH